MGEFRMPSLGADMESGTLVEWRVQPGETVRRGDVVAVVATDKGAIDVEIFETGVIERLLVAPGVKVPVGTPLALVRTNGKATQPPATAAAAGRRAPESAGEVAAARTPHGLPVPPATPPGPVVAPRGERLRISPLARRRAAELGVDVALVQGTGPGGAVSVEDVERFVAGARKAAAAPEVPAGPPVAPVEPEPPAAPRGRPRPQEVAPAEAAREGMRRAIAAAMARSKREIPHYYLQTDIDMHRALAWLEAENRARPVNDRLLPAALLLKAVALAIHEVPEMNGFFVDGTYRPSEAVHVGVAISLRHGGLVAPAIHDTDKLPLDALMAALRDLVTRARTGGLRSSELSDPTITVSNLGEQGVGTVYGVIYPPQVALVGLGTIASRPWAVDGLLGVRPIVTATLSADHRVSDGHRGGRFLAAMGRLLQEPEKLQGPWQGT